MRTSVGASRRGATQLAQVALAWMVKQAEAAGVKMSPTPTTIIANPVIHDKSDSIMLGQPSSNDEDREIHYGDGTMSQMRTTTFPQGMSYADTLQFIDYLPVGHPLRQSYITGSVDMQGYLH